MEMTERELDEKRVREQRRFVAAVAAMQGMWAGESGVGWTSEEIAIEAVYQADALLRRIDQFLPMP